MKKKKHGKEKPIYEIVGPFHDDDAEYPRVTYVLPVIPNYNPEYAENLKAIAECKMTVPGIDQVVSAISPLEAFEIICGVPHWKVKEWLRPEEGHDDFIAAYELARNISKMRLTEALIGRGPLKKMSERIYSIFMWSLYQEKVFPDYSTKSTTIENDQELNFLDDTCMIRKENT